MTLLKGRPVTQKRLLLLSLVGVLLLAGGWWFRPERAFIDHSVAEPVPAGTASVLLVGQFESRAHESRGRVYVLDLGAEGRVLRFDDFETLNGPDLQVYLLGSAATSGRDDLETFGYVSLGALKGNLGPQNYRIPDGVELSRYPAVSVWCRRFGVNFATAILVSPASGS
ncbi:MAG: DM13 domain-containing protein [Gemmatimonadetes bacterium]|nr:DM13 domain-containing protein [Gemmatimonadota bacterium]